MHVKTQAIVKGTLTIPANLPTHLAQGLFSGVNAGDHPVALRYANEPIFIQDDRAPGPRGVGMKIFNVAGEFLDAEGAQTRTHDMTFNNAPALELRDLPTALEIFRLRNAHYAETDDGAAGLTAALERRPDAAVQLAPARLPNRHFLSYTMYSQAAYRFAQHVAKFALVPSAKRQRDMVAAPAGMRAKFNAREPRKVGCIDEIP